VTTRGRVACRGLTKRQIGLTEGQPAGAAHGTDSNWRSGPLAFILLLSFVKGALFMTAYIVSAFFGLMFLSTGSVATEGQTKAETGQQLYVSKQCSKCHHIAGKGAKIGKLDGVATKLSAADLRKWLTAPAEMEAKLKTKPVVKMSSKVREMKLTDPEVDALVAYLQTLK
jgi:cytochrome c553